MQGEKDLTGFVAFLKYPNRRFLFLNNQNVCIVRAVEMNAA